MSKKELLNVARNIRAAMTEPAAGCYRLHKLPRAATITAIYNILAARISGDWSVVFNSDLYNNHGSDYCNILAVSHDFLQLEA